MNWIADNKDLIIALIGAATTIFGIFYPMLPTNIRKVLSAIGGNEMVLSLIKDAALMKDTDDAGRMGIVADELVKLATLKGQNLNKTDAIIIVQNAYRLYKRLT